MKNQRFQVRSITGYTETGQESTSYFIVDTEWNYKEVASDYSQSRGNRSNYVRKIKIHLLADKLNAEYAG